MPHVCGAIDGKYVALPPNIGSLYLLQGVFSVRLVVLVNVYYKFLWCDVGDIGIMSDCVIFNESKLKHCLAYKTTYTLET